MYQLIYFRETTPPQNRQLDILMSDLEQNVQDFVGGIDFLKLINKDILSDEGEGGSQLRVESRRGGLSPAFYT